MTSSTDNRTRPTGIFSMGETVSGRFIIKRLLGEGGMGKVYLAEQLPMGRKVALKVLRPDLSSDEGAVKRFFREALAVSRLQHPNTVTLFDYGESEKGDVFIAMEYLEGMSLKDLLAVSNKTSADRALNIIAQVALSLAEAHRKEIVHRDLKPDNIILADIDGQRDFVKVIDFGIAHLTAASGDSRITQAGFVCGTPEYMSPEQARGDSLDGRADLYSLGIILFEMLEGYLPFVGETPLATVLKHQTDEVPALSPTHSQAVRALCQRLVAKEPEDRPESAEHLLRELKALAPPGSPLSGLVLATSVKLKRKGTVKAVATTSSPNTEELFETLADEEFLLPKRKYGWIAAGLIVILSLVAISLSLQKTEDNAMVTEPETADGHTGTDVEDASETQLAAAPTARVRFASTPDFAQLYIDNRNIGLTPLPVDLEIGQRVEVIIQREGFEPFAQTIEVALELDGTTVQVDLVTLQSHITVSSEPEGATVVSRESGEILGTTPFELDVERSTRPIEVELRLNRYRSAQRVMIPSEPEVALHVDLERQRTRTPNPPEDPPGDDGEDPNPFGHTVD